MKSKSDKKQDEPVRRLAVRNALKVMKPKQKRPADKSLTEYLAEYGITGFSNYGTGVENEQAMANSSGEAILISDDSQDNEPSSEASSEKSTTDENDSSVSPEPAFPTPPETAAPAPESRNEKLVRLHALIPANGARYNDLKLEMLLKTAEQRNIIV